MNVYSLDPLGVLLAGGLIIATAVIWFIYLNRPVKSKLTEQEQQTLKQAFQQREDR